MSRKPFFPCDFLSSPGPVYRFYTCKSTRESPVFGTRGDS